MLTTSFIDEQELPLEFSSGRRHVDIRFGIMTHGVLDRDSRETPLPMRLGLIGVAGPNEQFIHWLENASSGVPAKESSQPNLFPRFPGFGADSPFNAVWTCDPRAQRTLLSRDITQLVTLTSGADIVRRVVDLYLAEIAYLANETELDVIICIVPDEILDHLDRAAELNGTSAHSSADDRDEDDGNYADLRHDFHHCLKANAMTYRKPIQIVLPSTFNVGARGKSTKKRRPQRKRKPRALQDPATRAWNFFTALYYKAGGVPWRLPRESSDYSTCYVGIGFYRSLDEARVSTSIAQIFNERGEGIIVRGGAARESKDDRTPHLNEHDAAAILIECMTRYRDEHKTLPARLVLHKTSYFDAQEIAGIAQALQQERVQMADMLSIRKSSIRLFRDGLYPVLRGTHVELGGPRHLLYTRGSIPFFETYPGLYVPRALEVLCDRVEQGRETLCREILSLTKMNWNNTQFDMREPITVRAARCVGDILKYVPETVPADQIARRYSFYM
jgi:hypothetical protein